MTKNEGGSRGSERRASDRSSSGNEEKGSRESKQK